MKRIIFAAVVIFLFIFINVLRGANENRYQMVDIYVCGDWDPAMAELSAKVKVSRKELLTVSYCTCIGKNHY
jgi:hypothetical protein